MGIGGERPSLRPAGRLYASPASLLEIQFLIESGRVRLHPGATAEDLILDDRWLLDEPPSVGWFQRALEVSWTRDPFDRLLVAHARLRGWRLATGDAEILDRLGPEGSVEL